MRLFDLHLLNSLAERRFQSQPMLADELNEAATNIVQAFTYALTDDELAEGSDVDIEELFDQFLAYEDLEEYSELLKEIINLTAEEIYGEANRDNIKKVLQGLKGVEVRYPSQSGGMAPAKEEGGIRKILHQHPISVQPDAYGNDKVFQGSGVKVYNREKDRMGKNYNYKNDYNQQGGQPLQNPLLTSQCRGWSQKIEACDSVGTRNR